MKNQTSRPTAGQLITIYGHKCRIVTVHPFGTLDVETLDGSRAWRVTGLAFI